MPWRSTEEPRVSDYMVRNPLFAELWQPIGLIRQQMLANSFSFLPVLQGENWGLLSDREVAIYLRAGSNRERKRRLATPLDHTQIHLQTAECVKEEASLQDALKASKIALLCASVESGVYRGTSIPRYLRSVGSWTRSGSRIR